MSVPLLLFSLAERVTRVNSFFANKQIRLPFTLITLRRAGRTPENYLQNDSRVLFRADFPLRRRSPF